MKTPQLTLEQICYIVALTAAVVVRFIFLNQAALPDSEAVLALQSLHLAQGIPVVIGPNPGYVLPTALIMFLAGASNWTARLVPALMGVLAAGIPYLMRDRLGRMAAVMLAFFLALDPGLVAVSRQAGGQMIGLAALLLAIVCFMQRKAVWAGLFASLALLGGPSIWPNAAMLALAGWLASRGAENDKSLESIDLRAMGLTALAVFTLVGTCFFIFPTSLSAGFSSLPAYIQGWTLPPAVPVLQMLAALVGYEAFGLVLGLGGALRGAFNNRIDRFLLLWWLLGLALALIYPARQVFDLDWTVVPLLILAARWLAPMFDLETDRKAIYGQACLILLLLIMIANLVVSWPAGDANSGDQLFRYLVLGVAILLIAAETFLVIWGWSSRIGLYGLALGIAAALFVFSLSALGNATGYSGRPPAELWSAGPAFAQADLVTSTLHDYVGWRPDAQKVPSVILVNLDSPALEWLLRDYPGLRVEKAVPTEVKPEFMLSLDTTKVDQTAAYTGTSFDLARSPDWALIAPKEWVNWLFYRSIPTEVWKKQAIVLWVRSDLFPGASTKAVTP